MYICQNCGIEFEAKKEAKTCSALCRKNLSRKKSVTPNVTLGAVDVTDVFEFTVPYRRTPKDEGYDSDVEASYRKPRKAVYWYDVPIAAIPVIKKDWPKMPEFMNGRQYFLWWKNDFKVEGDTPIIHNPFSVVQGSK